MRNYSSISRDTHTFISYHIGGEYKTGNPESILRSVVRAVVSAFEVSDIYQDNAYKAVASSTKVEDVDGLAPSETRVLLELQDFFFTARKRYEARFGEVPRSNQSFIYVNVNTGVSVVWTSIVE